MTNRGTPRRQRHAMPSDGDTRELSDLVSIGPAILRDLKVIGVHRVAQLARAKPEALYERLCKATGQSHDICCLDVFSAAVAQARNPKLPKEQRRWLYWSQRRKESEKQ